ncbi:MAG: YidC/Oxa1 family membrane protein insertase [Lachnospiraceae bacterium]|nr:YidC/Oxa1 family membrane protein insertase [Lachnospiraceae bacterium]
MNFIFLTQVSGILKPFAWIMGKILNLVYMLVAWMGIPNIALCIVLFTIAVKMLTLPLTIKQQRSAKFSAKMQPELRAIQEKYKGYDRSDREAMYRMQEETSAVYRKYGTSPLGGCLPLIIMLFVVFALYRVIYSIPAYVQPVKDLYTPISSDCMTKMSSFDFDPEDDAEKVQDGYLSKDATAALQQFMDAEKLTLRDRKAKKEKNWNENRVIDLMTVLGTEAWEDFLSGKVFYVKDTVTGEMKEDPKYSKWNAFCQSDAFKEFTQGKTEAKEDILRVNSLFGGYNILDPPGWKLTPMLLIPILAAVLQYIQSALQMKVQKSGDEKKKDDNPTAASMEGMMKIMPVVSGVFCVFFPIGVGIYWVVNSGVSILQQQVINRKLDKISIEDVVAANEAKVAERNKKLGIVSNGTETSSIAKTKTKTIASYNNSGKQSDSDGKRPAQKVSDKKKDELAKNAAEGKSNISAIANLYRNDDDE